MRIHLVAIDVDGTLLNSSNEVSNATAAVLRQARKEDGVHIVLATARPPRSVMPFYRLLDLDSPMINYNGALVYDPPSNRVLLHVPVGPKLARQVVRAARAAFPGVSVSAEIIDRWYTDRVDNTYITQTGRVFRPDLVGPIDDWLTQPVTKLLLLGPPEQMAGIGAMLAKTFKHQVIIMQTEGELLQIMHPTVSKAQALKTVAGELGVTRQQVMAIGDNANDVEMLRWAGLGVAMANAAPAAIAAADAITDHQDRDGVAKAIHTMIMKGRPLANGDENGW